MREKISVEIAMLGEIVIVNKKTACSMRFEFSYLDILSASAGKLNHEINVNACF